MAKERSEVMEQRIRELICDQERWTHAHGESFYISFNEDGTGEVRPVTS